MGLDQIKFGTDGWRAVIAEQFTFANVKRVARAYARFILNERLPANGIAVGFDTRFLSREFAAAFAAEVAAYKIPVWLSDRFIPTPVLSFTVKQRNLAGGVMITASHNPYQYNGIKFKDEYGGPVLNDTTHRIATALDSEARAPNGAEKANAYIQNENFVEDYIHHLDKRVDLQLIRKLDQTVIFCPMHGAGIGLLPQIIGDASIQWISIMNSVNPLFNFRHPEPITENLAVLKQRIKEEQAYIGIATDGDADRLGIMDEKGRFVQLHDLMPILLKHLRETKPTNGKVVRSTSMADTVDRVAADYNINVIEVPVGFKNVTREMINQQVILGGEESGGFGYGNHLPERDGILSALLTMECLAKTGKSMAEHVGELRDRYGPFAYGRVDQYGDAQVIASNLQRLCQTPPQKLGPFKVDTINTMDGIKLYFTDRSWMLIRASQTEPLARIYAAADRQTKVKSIIQHGKALIFNK
ncbi:MAG: phosphoglucomutase/phosphomannomutase family protein [Caldithrix sp.]|nr:phosphoglucomutase/phosphomannomutase family protein [Caldithrix sp.]